MAAIGDMDLSLMSAQQKLAVSLFNIDFTMLRMDAPTEYQAIGSLLSVNRKQEAEGGALHGVARKLGALFETDLPHTPNLLRAYGQRASEISINQKFNPQGSRRYGAFAEHIGVDGTSLWAAATSGQAAIAAHLLACLLAAPWSGPHATSILSEMVEARKAILQKRLKASSYSISEVTAAHITFTRDELAAWDASARAWLQTADEAFLDQQRELMRIVRQFVAEDISQPDLYTSVERVWHRSMEMMENLLSGKPQTVLDAEPLVGLAAWHLYPDMTVLGDSPRDIRHHDSLFAPGGILTLGMAAKVASLKNGITWSLPLSHLRFYGRPIMSTGVLAGDSERVTFSELRFMVLGALTGHWFPKHGGMDKVTEFLVNLTECLAPLETGLPQWLELMASTAREYITAKDQLRQAAARLFRVGYHRGTRFMSLDDIRLPEAFGLLNFEPFVMNVANPEDAISLIRAQLPRLIEDSTLLENGFISYIPPYKQDGAGRDQIHSTGSHNHAEHPDAFLNITTAEEFATICSRTCSSGSEKHHQRWIPSYHADTKTGSRTWGVPGMLSPLSTQVARCKTLASSTNESCGLYYRPIDVNSGYNNEHSSKHDVGVPLLDLYEQVDVTSLTTDEKTIKRARRSLRPPFEAGWTKVLRTSDKDWTDIIEAENTTLPKRKSPRDGVPLAVWYDTLPSLHTNVPPARFVDINISPRGIFPWPGRMHYKSTGSSVSKKQSKPVERSMLLSTEHLTGPFCTGLRDIMDLTSTGYFAIDLGCPEKYYVPAAAVSAFEERTYQMLLGDDSRFGVWLPIEANLDELQVDTNDLLVAIKKEASYATAVLQRLNELWNGQFSKCKRCLNAFLYAAHIFESFPEITIDISVMKNPLCDAMWSIPYNVTDFPLGSSFACLAMFESGSLNINPIELKDVIAMASGNSLFMAEYIFSDPFKEMGKHLIRRTIGSIGRPGRSFLLPARVLDSLELEKSSWRHVQYADFDGKYEDHFPSTTLHLTFTGDEQPLNIGQTGYRDKQAFLIETVVRAYDKRRWIADLDLTSVYQYNTYLTRQSHCGHTEGEQQTFTKLLPITSVDTWDEFLDLPQNLCIFRAKDNWLARQAASAFAIQRKKQIILTTGTLCWKCILESKHPTSDLLIIN